MKSTPRFDIRTDGHHTTSEWNSTAGTDSGSSTITKSRYSCIRTSEILKNLKICTPIKCSDFIDPDCPHSLGGRVAARRLPQIEAPRRAGAVKRLNTRTCKTSAAYQAYTLSRPLLC